MTKDFFQQITEDIAQQGYTVQSNGLPGEITDALAARCTEQTNNFAAAGLGRGTNFRQQSSVRRDNVLWIDGSTAAEQAWLTWCEQLREHLNRELFLGLFSFESHFAHYQPGDFYKRHLDTFRDENTRQTSNDKPQRKLSLTTYFNRNWQAADGGELVIYPTAASEQAIARVAPELGTVCLFLSNEFPHEVLPASRDRFSIAGWFRGS